MLVTIVPWFAKIVVSRVHLKKVLSDASNFQVSLTLIGAIRNFGPIHIISNYSINLLIFINSVSDLDCFINGLKTVMDLICLFLQVIFIKI